MNKPIDFVITWVDGNDPEWLNKKNDALESVNKARIDVRKRRFRDWNNLMYLFRGIAKYAPWVNHIYLVTPNQTPSWLNTKNSRVTIVNQDDLFDDKSILPTFNNCAVELLFHKIPGLSDQFVYLNDDMFFVGPTQESDFFKNGLPCITAAISPILPHYSEDGKGTYGIDVSNFSLVAKHFHKKEMMRNNWTKYLDIKNGREIIKTLCCLPFTEIPGFNEMHTAYSYLKCTYDEVWQAESNILAESCRSRFRGDFCYNHHAMRYWQLSKGIFSVRKRSFSRMCDVSAIGDEESAIHCILNRKPKMICINDSISDDSDFEAISIRVNDAFAIVFPDKCEFEI